MFLEELSNAAGGVINTMVIVIAVRPQADVQGLFTDVHSHKYSMFIHNFDFKRSP